jgi:DNA-3-methyladenine glycosylase
MITDEFAQLLDDPVVCAKRLLGCQLVMQHDTASICLKIVETEAYHQSDAASHSYKGKTPRTDVMFGPPGYLYVYFTYGMHYCMNVVTGPEGEGSAVLIRAVEPLSSWELLRSNRPGLPDKQLTNGPAKLCKALAIDTSWNGHDLRAKPLQLQMQPSLKDEEIVQTTRIGISQAQDKPWRFYIRDNPYVSKLAK